MTARSHDALLLDLDGTLVSDAGQVRPRVRDSLRAAEGEGVTVMVVTGRSGEGTAPVLTELGLGGPAVVYNGAGLYCPRTDRLLEERLLSNRAMGLALDFARERGHLLLVQRAGRKFASQPRDERERTTLSGLEATTFCDGYDVPTDYAIRATLFSDRHASSGAFCDEVAAAVDLPVYWTHFPLAALAAHRRSPYQVVDVHAPCRGKAEALRVLEERYGIPPERAVAVGDATNDIPMFEAAGLGVAMEGSMPEAIAAADRVIGSNDSDTIADLVEELFGVSAGR